jgi:hypothetical protein
LEKWHSRSDAERRRLIHDLGARLLYLAYCQATTVDEFTSEIHREEIRQNEKLRSAIALEETKSLVEKLQAQVDELMAERASNKAGGEQGPGPSTSHQ